MTTGRILCALALSVSLMSGGSQGQAATTTMLGYGGSQGQPATTTKTTLQCTTIGVGNVILMRANFEATKRMPRLFSAVFRGKHDYGAGRKMTVVAGGVDIGTLKLKPIVGGDVAGELRLNYAPVFGDHTKPFPAGFPEIKRNTDIAVETGGKIVLSCRLE